MKSLKNIGLAVVLLVAGSQMNAEIKPENVLKPVQQGAQSVMKRVGEDLARQGVITVGVEKATKQGRRGAINAVSSFFKRASRPKRAIVIAGFGVIGVLGAYLAYNLVTSLIERRREKKRRDSYISPK